MGPPIAYTRSGTIVAQAGPPAREASAYPIPTGTRNAANTRPAIVSRTQATRVGTSAASTPPARTR